MDQHSTVYIASVADADTEKLRSAVAKLTGGVRPTGSVQITSAAEAKTPSINPAIESLASLAYGGMAVTMAVAIVSIVCVNHWRTAGTPSSVYVHATPQRHAG